MTSAHRSGGNTPGWFGMGAGGAKPVFLGPELLLAVGSTVPRVLLYG